MKKVPRPATRPLKIYPTDPTRGYEAARTATILVENEPLEPGPRGERIEVIDYDGSENLFYDAVDLEDPAILMQGGLDPSESDPRFHQQMVYAVAARTLANFDRALGRRVSMRKGSRLDRLRLFPHAFRGENAYYDRTLHAILFGYFEADPFQFGTNMPRQPIFTCLSHDIIAHEMTHAIVDRLRFYFLEPTNVDVLAFHEGFADIVALLQHFSFPALLASEIGKQRGQVDMEGVLVNLATQFGYGSGSGNPLRSALGKDDARLYANVREPHARGAILVAAVFDGFFATYKARTRDLIRIATGGSGELPPGDLHPDLVNRIAGEAARLAQRQLDMCIRAFDYLPPVDITYGDYLRAMVTGDFELNPDDESGLRAALIEGFRRRGIYPSDVISLAEGSLRWEPPQPPLPRFSDQLETLLPLLLQEEAKRFTRQSTDPRLATGRDEREFDSVEEADERPQSAYSRMRTELVKYATTHARALRLHPGMEIYVSGLNAVFRTAPSGALLIELVAQLLQTDKASAADPAFGGIPARGGCTIIVGVDGVIRYIISKPLPGAGRNRRSNAKAQLRIAEQKKFVDELDARDPLTPYMSAADHAQRMKARMSLRALHGGQ